MKQYLLGYDLGSSSVKASLIEAQTGKSVVSAASPEQEMEISSPRPDQAEQHPDLWWFHTRQVTHQILLKSEVRPEHIKGIGIAYQMHGLVVVDRNLQVLRPAIIWCDSRAVEIGNKAFQDLGISYCMENLLNSPGNFTASKLKWVMDNEPAIYDKIFKIMLPGDYLAMRLTGTVTTTSAGLSEGILWDYRNNSVPDRLLNYFNIDRSLIPDQVPTFSVQGRLTQEAARQLGLAAGTPVCYRAGDQPNNAFSLNVLHPGETAATAGTSGVIYAVTNKPVADKLARVNTFIHVNHAAHDNRLGVLLCINGTGIMNSWLRKNLQLNHEKLTYTYLNQLAASIPAGSEGLYVLPFGNGAERVLRNRHIGASIMGLNLNRHSVGHLCRATQEGIVFALAYGFEVLQELGIHTSVIRAGMANMFLSEVFCDAFVNVIGVQLSLYNTDGAQGAARGAGVGVGLYANPEEAHSNLVCVQQLEPDSQLTKTYRQAYIEWKEKLDQQLHDLSI